MCWETSLTKCYPLRNNRATITSIIVLGLTLGLGPGCDAKLIFTNGGSYIQHLQLPLRLSTTTVQYQIWNGPNALFNWDIFWHFLQFSCKWCSFGSQQTAPQYGWNLWPTVVGVQWCHACHALVIFQIQGVQGKWKWSVWLSARHQDAIRW